MGNHKEYLVIMEAEASVTIQRFGRLYGNPPFIRVSWNGSDLDFQTFNSRDELEVV